MKRRTARRNKRSLSGWRALAFGVGAGIVSLVITALIAALVCYLSNDPMAISDVASLAALLLGGGIAGFITPRITEDGAILPAALSALLLPLLMLLIGILTSGGNLSPRIPLNLLCYFGVSVISSLLSKRTMRA